jgi:dTDP-glucose 4,6-dehydratase
MKKLIITGGSGFIGTNFIKYLLTSKEVNEELYIINIDKLTYAGSGKNLDHAGISNNKRYKFINADIADRKLIPKIFEEEKPEIVFNFAAESHVDRSIESAEDFAQSNILGTVNLLDASKKYGVKKFIQISTDEVYGSTKEGSFDENSILNPSSPYSASKASAELLAKAYFITYKLPVIITRSANNYGPYQFPEKLLPLFITNLIEKKKVPLMWSEDNPGLNVRDWLHVEDNCRAIWFLSKNGDIGNEYNIPGENERKNIEMTKMLLDYFSFKEDMIQKVDHRKGHDFRYSIDGNKLKSLGFKYNHLNLNKEVELLCKWYKDNESWWRPLKK